MWFLIDRKLIIILSIKLLDINTHVLSHSIGGAKNMLNFQIGKGDHRNRELLRGVLLHIKLNQPPVSTVQHFFLVSSTKQMLFGKAVVVAKQQLKSPSKAWHSFAEKKNQVIQFVLSVLNKKKYIAVNTDWTFGFSYHSGTAVAAN